MHLRTLIAQAACTAVLAGVGGCGPRSLSAGEGFVQVPGGRVWYRIVGSGTRTPLLVLHGGPGAASYYLKPLAGLADERPVVFYDQLGGGHSDRPDDTSLWRIERFVEELGAVRRALGLAEVHLYGHSWGTMLAADYMLARPAGVRSLILASPALSMARWIHDADSLRATLPDSVQAAITRHEQAGTTGAPEYQAGMMLYYQQFLARRQPWSADIDTTFAELNPAVYGYMQGPSEFTITGTLKGYDRTDRLHEITVPTLFTTGRHDEASPSTVAFYQSLVPGSELAIIENSGHLTMQDEPERYLEVLREFLRGVEGR
jgi:proline iminopeptidase